MAIHSGWVIHLWYLDCPSRHPCLCLLRQIHEVEENHFLTILWSALFVISCLGLEIFSSCLLLPLKVYCFTCYFHVYACMGLCVPCACRSPSRQEEGVASPAAASKKGGYELSHRCLGLNSGPLCEE